MKTAAAAGLLSTGLTPFGLVTGARASWVGIVLAIGAAIAGAIAAHNRRDVGFILTKSMKDELRVGTTQLAALQSATAVILSQLADVPSVVEKLLFEQETRRLHNNVNGAIKRYDSLRATIPDFGDDVSSWLKASDKIDELRAILRSLRENRALISLSASPIDPSSALVVAPCALCEVSIMNLLQHDPRDVRGAIGEYEVYFGRVENSQLPGSARRYVEERKKIRDTMDAQLDKNPVFAAMKRQRQMKSSAIGACAGIQDLTPSYRQVVDYTYQRLGRGIDAVTIEKPIYETVPARVGRTMWLSRSVTYIEENAEENPEIKDAISKLSDQTGANLNSTSAQLLLWRLVRGEENYQPSQPSPEDKSCVFEARNIPGAPDETFKGEIRKTSTWANAHNVLEKIEGAFNSRNLESAKISYGEQSIDAVHATLDTLKRVKRSYE